MRTLVCRVSKTRSGQGAGCRTKLFTTPVMRVSGMFPLKLPQPPQPPLLVRLPVCQGAERREQASSLLLLQTLVRIMLNLQVPCPRYLYARHACDCFMSKGAGSTLAACSALSHCLATIIMTGCLSVPLADVWGTRALLAQALESRPQREGAFKGRISTATSPAQALLSQKVPKTRPPCMRWSARRKGARKLMPPSSWARMPPSSRSPSTCSTPCWVAAA